MTLIDGFVKDQIFVDFDSEIIYGSDQQNVNYPSRFPTVGFQLMATYGLSQIADRIRKDAGFKPMHPTDEFTDDTCDSEGWYVNKRKGPPSAVAAALCGEKRNGGLFCSCRGANPCCHARGMVNW